MRYEGIVTPYSQTDILRRHLRAADISHGERARVNVVGVTVTRNRPKLRPNQVSVEFSDLKWVEPVSKSGHPDGHNLPTRVRLEEVKFTGYGFWDLLNFELELTGSIYLWPTVNMGRIIRHGIRGYFGPCSLVANFQGSPVVVPA